MLRNRIIAGLSLLTAVVMFVGTAKDAAAIFDDPYVPGCRVGYCGGGDYYLPCPCRGCTARSCYRFRDRYSIKQGSTVYSPYNTYTPPRYATTPPPSPEERR